MAKDKPRKQAEFKRWMGPILDALRELGGSGTPKQVEEIIARVNNEIVTRSDLDKKKETAQEEVEEDCSGRS